MDLLKKLSPNEKVMIGFILLFIVMVALSWGRISEGFKKSINQHQNNTEKSVQDE